MKNIKIRIPGKLFLGGEYAIMHPKQAALVLTLDAFLEVKLTPARHYQLLTQHRGETITFNLKTTKQNLKEKDKDERFALMLKAQDIAHQYLDLQGKKTLAPYRLSLTSQLDDPETKQKYGLGSSAAVTIGVLRGILTYYGLLPEALKPADALLLFKLAVLCQSSLQMAGSYADLAAAAFTGCIAYQNFDHRAFALLHTQKNPQLETYLSQDWPGLKIQTLPWPKAWSLVVHWDQEASSTSRLLKEGQPLTPSWEKNFQKESQNYVLKQKKAITTANFSKFKKASEQLADLLLAYTQRRGKNYDTQSFQKVRQLVQHQKNLAWKISGAGGGDCSLAIAKNKTAAEQFKEELQAAGLRYLDLKFYQEGASHD